MVYAIAGDHTAPGFRVPLVREKPTAADGSLRRGLLDQRTWKNSVNESWLVAIHLVFTLIMVGIIWFVQIVHYPLMAYVGAEHFREYSKQHQRLTTWVVGGPMLLEAGTAAALVWYQPARILAPVFGISCGLLVLIWISTAYWQMPHHEKLLEGFDEVRIEKLVRSNWLRTFAWSIRGLLIGLSASW